MLRNIHNCVLTGGEGSLNESVLFISVSANDSHPTVATTDVAVSGLRTMQVRRQMACGARRSTIHGYIWRPFYRSMRFYGLSSERERVLLHIRGFD